MKIKFTFLFLTLFCLLQLFSCSGKQYAFLDSVSLVLTHKYVDSNGNDSFANVQSDSLLSFQKLQINIWENYVIAQSTLPNLDLQNAAFAFSKEYPTIYVQDKVTEVSFILLYDYNANFRAGDEAFDLLSLDGIHSKQQLIDYFNNKILDGYFPTRAITAKLKESPSDTVDFAVRIIIENQEGEKFHSKSEDIKLY